MAVAITGNSTMDPSGTGLPGYSALLGLAEHFRMSNPPDIKLCVHCLQAVFTLKPAPMIEARTHLQIGQVLSGHTKNVDLALLHLDRAWTLSQNIIVHSNIVDNINTIRRKFYAVFLGRWMLTTNPLKLDQLPSSEEIRFEAASLSGQLYEQQKRLHEAKVVLQSAIDSSQLVPYWHCRLLFQLAQLLVQEGDYNSAAVLLGSGADYAALHLADYTKIIFLLSRGMVLLIDKKHSELLQVLTQSGVLIEQCSSSISVQQKESLKVFFLILQVCHYLMAGQVKTVKPALKQLQQSIQTISSLHLDDGNIVLEYWAKVNQDLSRLRKQPTRHILRALSCQPVQVSNPIDLFQWLPKEHMCVLVYLMTVMHSVQAGYMEKAQKYTDKALMQIEKLKMLDSHPLLASFQVMLLEHIVMCRLITGNKTLAIQEIFQACHVCQQQPRLVKSHQLQIHALLGLYAMSINCMEAAEAQFKTALMTSDPELWTFVNLNLALVYLRSNRHTDFMSILETIEPDRLGTTSHSLRACGFYVKGLQAFFQARYHDAKRYLRETLKMANAEDLNRLTSCSLVLLGHIFLSLGNSQEALNMVTPAMQLAGKIPDVHVQLWSSALLKDLYRIVGNPQGEAENYRLHETFSQMLLKDHFQSTQLSEHRLIEWTEGPCPFYIVSTSAMNSSADCLITGWAPTPPVSTNACLSQHDIS